jgi:hypothetical protein
MKHTTIPYQQVNTPDHGGWCAYGNSMVYAQGVLFWFVGLFGLL